MIADETGKTRAEADELKQNWLDDPYWKLWPVSEGYEAYSEEFRLFQQENTKHLAEEIRRISARLGFELVFPSSYCLEQENGSNYRENGSSRRAKAK